MRRSRSQEPVCCCQRCGTQPGRLAGSELKVMTVVVCCCAGLADRQRGSELQTQWAKSLSAAAAGSPACVTLGVKTSKQLGRYGGAL